MYLGVYFFIRSALRALYYLDCLAKYKSVASFVWEIACCGLWGLEDFFDSTHQYLVLVEPEILVIFVLQFVHLQFNFFL